MTGEELREEIKSKGIALKSVAEELGMSQQALNKRLKAKNVKADFLEQIRGITGKDLHVKSESIDAGTLLEIIQKQSEEIGRLKQRVEDLEQQRGKDASDAADTIAHAG